MVCAALHAPHGVRRAARKHLGANAITNYASEESTDFLDPKSKSGTWGGVDGDVFSVS